MDPVRVRLPAGAPGATLRDHLVQRLAAPPAKIDALFTAGDIVGADGRPVPPDTPCTPGLTVWFHREMPPEPPVPFPLRRAPGRPRRRRGQTPLPRHHPRGSHVRQTALARLRHDLGLPRLTAAHRLDRLTAGLVLFTVRPDERGAYQTLFRDRRVQKEYEAVAPFNPTLALPRTIRSRIVKERGELTAREVDGEPNAETRVELLTHREDGLAWYRLVPGTGQTHQLRVHMSALGVPILGDPLYPEVTAPVPPGDFRRPLQLLARELAFTDPVTGTERRFTSSRTLEAWTSYNTWAAYR